MTSLCKSIGIIGEDDQNISLAVQTYMINQIIYMYNQNISLLFML